MPLVELHLSAAPACLPLAGGLVHRVGQQMIGPYSSYVDNLRMRPEVFFQIIAKYDAIGLIHQIGSILRTASTNRNHVFLARCLALNNHVITTNFDLMIEHACLDESVRVSRTTGAAHAPLTGPVLYKIHGSLDDPDSMLVTIDVNRGLGENRLALLRELTASRCVVVLG